MRGLLRASIVVAALTLPVAAGTQAADWELWPEMSVPENPWCCLPNTPDNAPGDTLITAESPDGVFFVDVGQTREKDGLVYKAVQIHRDYEFFTPATVTVGQYMLLSGFGWPVGTANSVVDASVVQMVATCANLVSVEIDDQTVPVDPSMIIYDELMPGYEGGVYAVFPRFSTPGEHTMALTYQPTAEFYYVEPYEVEELADPSPEYEGRRVFVPEQVGDPVDGRIVLKYNLNVVPPETAVEPCSWARVKAALVQ